MAELYLLTRLKIYEFRVVCKQNTSGNYTFKKIYRIDNLCLILGCFYYTFGYFSTYC